MRVELAARYRDRLRERLMLLHALGGAGAGPVTALCVGYTVSALAPAATAAAMGLLIGRVQHAAGDSATVLVPVALFAGVLLVGHCVDAGLEPLRYLVKARVDGAQRIEVARLAVAVPTIDRLEDPSIQDLVRTASADAANWTEKTPGDGAVAQVGVLARYASAAAAAAVLAAYGWWLIPLLMVPAFVGRVVRCRDFVTLAHLWAGGIRHGRRADYWKRTVMSPAGGKEQRVYGFGRWAVDQVGQALREMFDPAWAFGGRLRRRSTATAVLMFVPLAVAYAVVAADVVRGRTTLAVETAVFAAGLGVYVAVGGSFDGVDDIEGVLPSLRAAARLREELSGAGAVPSGPAMAVRASTGTPRVELTGIHFTYPGTDRLVLDGLDLTIRPGEMLAIVGLNGAGKSTLVKLLTGLYQPDQGRITADGLDIRDIGIAAWRQRVSVVFQDFVRYQLSAAENVALGAATVPVDPAALERAAGAAGLNQILDRLPDGWQTPLTRSRPGGVDLSGGQWQQVALARALYAVQAGARVLVLDEPTAHLDVRSELELFNRLLARPEDATVVLISHRLSTVRWADRIVLLERGRVAESGTHEELMRLDGAYAVMFRTQAERFTRGYDDRLDEGDPG